MLKNAFRRLSSTNSKQKIGFIGLGNMGQSMSRNLVSKGFQVSGFDLNEHSLIKAEINGVKPATSISDAVKNAEYVVTCLPRTADVQNALTDPLEGVFHLAEADTMILDTSTISPVAAKQLSFDAKKHQMIFCDTPMAGGTQGAEKATLTFMVGAENQFQFDQVKIVLDAMGKTVIHCGGPGDGGAAKLVNNMILGIMMIASSEGLALGEKLGIDAKTLHKVLTASSANNWCLNNYNPYPGIVESAPSSRDYQGGFQTALIRKDLSLASDAALEVGASVKVAEMCMEIFAKLEENGDGQKDFGVVFQHILKNEGQRQQDSAVPDILLTEYKKYL